MKWRWLLVFSFLFGNLNAQKILELAPFDVVDSTEVGLQSSFNITYDSLSMEPMQSLNLVEFLTTRSSLNFKNYGPGLLATPTFRGGDANHTQLLWNGLKINSPMLGTIDFSTIPMAQFSSISLVTGNSMNLYATGGLGGGVLLNQSVNYNQNYIQASQTLSSFENYSQSIRINQNFSLFKMPASFSLNGDLQSLNNRFPFTDVSEEPFETSIMENASFNRRNISPMLSFMPSESINVSLIYWYNEIDRSIPSAINTKPTIAQQKDEVHRTMAIADYRVNNRMKLSYRSMFEDNVNAYRDSALNISNSNDCQSFQNQLDVLIELNKKIKLNGQVNHTLIKATSQSYSQSEMATMLNGLLNLEYLWLNEKVLFELGTRYASFNADKAVLPFGGISIKPWQYVPIAFSASASQSTRFPTLIEIYWNPGGNDSLKSEQGELLELAVNYTSKDLTIKVAAFKGSFTDRIRWLPDGGVFSPTNVDYSSTLGTDLFIEKSIRLKQHVFLIRGNGQYINAQGGATKEDMTALSFIPSFSANASIAYQYRKLHINYSYLFLGERYISNDESSYMPSYQLSSLSASYDFYLLRQTKLGLTAGIDNVFDWQYQNMPWRPMPGRMYTLQINFIWTR